MKKVVIVIILIGAAVAAAISFFGLKTVPAPHQTGEKDFKTLQLELREKYPEVPQLSSDELAAWFQEGKSFVSLDVRSPEEFRVSHIRGAIRLSSSTAPDQFFAETDKDKIFVLYSAVGIRALDYAEKLIQAGFSGVYHLEGGIFQWAREGRPIYRDNEKTDKVHPHNEAEGRYLPKEIRAEIE